MRHHLIPKIAVIILLLSASTKLFATGAGAQLGCNPGILINDNKAGLEMFTGNVTGTVRLARFPIVAGAGLEGGKLYSDFNYGFSAFADYWLIDYQLNNTWNLFSGIGLSGKLLTKDFKDCSLAGGARIFAGVNYLLYDGYLEFYAQQNIVPTCVKNLSKSDSDPAFMLCLPLEAGLRMHF